MMNLDLELLQLYRCQDLAQLLEKTSAILSYFALPYCSLEWFPAPSTRAAMLENVSSVWDNFDHEVAQAAETLRRDLQSSIVAFIRNEPKASRAYLSWQHAQASLFDSATGPDQNPNLFDLQRDLISPWTGMRWQTSMSFPVCKERDRVLLFCARGFDVVNRDLIAIVDRIFETFIAAYRYLHSRTQTETSHAVPRMHDAPLSRREIECLQWLAAGKTFSETSCILGISERTLRFHVCNARDRLGVATTMQAVVAAALTYGFDPSDTRRSIYTASRQRLFASA